MRTLALWTAWLLLAPGQGGEDRAAARQLARAVDLFASYTGEWPAALEDLTRQPANARFWPEGGFWRGPLPPNASFKDGEIHCGGASAPVLPSPGSPIVPPTPRLREHYTACIRLLLIRSAVQAHLEARGTLPSDLGELPNDPWGKPFVVTFLKGRVRIAVQDAEKRQLFAGDLTEEESKVLDAAAVLPVSDGQRRAISGLIDKLADDDYETRLEASKELCRQGAAAGPILRGRAASEKDAEVRGRMEKLARQSFPPPLPEWKNHLRPLATVVLERFDRTAVAGCMNNLSQLWKMACIYSSKFGGRQKMFCQATGKEFWLALSKTEPKLIDAAVLNLYVCPASGLEAKEGVCSFRGPSSDVNKYGDAEPVGMCDDEGHEESVIILFKSNNVVEYSRSDPVYYEALKKTKR